MPQFEGTSARDDERPPTELVNFVEELLPPRQQANLARGIVWADILADIAADEQARQLRDAA